jgi:hypothetical protein
VNVTGRVADGDDFDGGTSDNISVGTFSVVSSTLTISNWVYLDSQNASRDDRYVSKADGTGIGNHDWMTGQAGDSYFRSRWNRDTDATCLSAVYPENSRWYQITWTYNNGTVGHYVNGSSQFGSCDNAVTGGALPNNTDGVYIGNQPGSGGEVQAPDGRLDEVRISNSVRGADWIATEYNNQSAPATFTTVGSEQTSSSPPENSGNAIYMGMGY